ncbi:MAG: Gp49 family protein [Lachnospiraceae bacterium]
MKKYIGTKLVKAKPMTRGEYNNFRGWQIPENENPEDKGYLVEYSDSYLTWSPKEVFEKAYIAVDDNKNLPSGVSIGVEMVDKFISYTETCTMGDRTTVVRCVLRNGFEIVESSSCVDPKNYSKEMGHEICMNKIKDKIRELLGFLLQTAWHGID